MTGKNLKVLVITSDNDTAKMLGKILSNEDFVSEIAPSGERALERIWAAPPHFILLHLDLNGMSGLDVLRIVREDTRSRHIPIISFSDGAEQAKILTCFNLQVDDYISQPFQAEELIARVKAVLNRRGPTHYEKDELLLKGKIQVHMAYHRVTCNGEEIKLTPKEYELLTLLLKKEGRILSRTYLLEAIWGLSGELTTRSVDMLVARLRKKLKKEGARWIETVQGYGYRIPKN